MAHSYTCMIWLTKANTAAKSLSLLASRAISSCHLIVCCQTQLCGLAKTLWPQISGCSWPFDCVTCAFLFLSSRPVVLWFPRPRLSFPSWLSHGQEVLKYRQSLSAAKDFFKNATTEQTMCWCCFLKSAVCRIKYELSIVTACVACLFVMIY